MDAFLNSARLLKGPWQAFERDVARALMFAGFDDVRIVAGTGDHGADILGVKNGQVWVVQCKHTTNSGPSPAAVAEVVNAAEFYKADKLAVASSRPVTPAFEAERRRFARQGVHVQLLDPEELRRLVDRLPTFPPMRRELRDYQIDAVERLRNSLMETGRGLIVFATGLGKTVVMAQTAAELLEAGLVRDNKILVLADKRELILQLQFGFWSQLPKGVPTHLLTGAEKPSFWDGITFATVQTAVGYADIPEFGLIFVDEAHHIGSPTFQEFIRTTNPLMIAGVTATPWRGDGFDLSQSLGPPLVRLGISDGLKEGHLSDVDYRLMADNLDWEFVQKESHHSYSVSQLNKRLIIPTRDEEAARVIAEVFSTENRRGGIIFSPSLDHAKDFSGLLRTFGLRAEAIGSDLEGRERDRLMARFRKGEIQIMASVDLFNEGVDVPDVDLIVFMRSTHSRRIFVQQLGRGLRLSPGKDKVVVLDFVTDLRRVAEIANLEAASSGPMERLPLGAHLVSFRDAASGTFLMEWLRDQADLFTREDDPVLELPEFDFPQPAPPGGVA